MSNFMFTNIYIIESDEGLLVIDTGITGTAGKILTEVNKIGFQPSDISKIILTHAHFDHFGSASRLKKNTGAQVLGHQADVKYFEKGGIGAFPGTLSKKTTTNKILQRKIIGAPPVQIDIPLVGGERIGDWEIIHTPGHTPGTINLYSKPRRVLITGGWAIPASSIEKSRGYKNPFVGHISSQPDIIEKSRLILADLNFDTLLCSHFPPRTFPLLKNQLKGIYNKSPS